MLHPSPYRSGVCAAASVLLVLCASASSSALAQTGQAIQPGQTAASASTLPPTPPTSLPSGPAPASAAPTPAPNPPHYAHVTFANNQLEIHADNSSLNQILHAISHLTGLKITGGVQDQRVYGVYGPAPAATVLATLLDGTGTNILLLEGSATTPPRLILTPRSGGAAPPSPDSPIYAAYDNPTYNPGTVSSPQPQQTSPQPLPPQVPTQSVPQSIPQPANNVNGSPSNSSPTASTIPTAHSVSLDSVPTPSTTPSTSGIVDSPNPPAPGSTTGASPGNTTLTPQMVAQRLLQMQQQTTQTPAAPPQPH